ncbi:hypothetical protein [Tuwongella immobilis]|uniref:hypothetical protein n=1 Tax=Tuwongella immobilis TaxID=692036 RepID=UPI001E4A8FC7|nr:hypothetical protein [Tuwongella immobilis]
MTLEEVQRKVDSLNQQKKQVERELTRTKDKIRRSELMKEKDKLNSQLKEWDAELKTRKRNDRDGHPGRGEKQRQQNACPDGKDSNSKFSHLRLLRRGNILFDFLDLADAANADAPVPGAQFLRQEYQLACVKIWWKLPNGSVIVETRRSR